MPSPILTVSQLNRQIKSWLEYDIGHVRVEGEISNLSRPSSGHFYFTLKDTNAQLRCVYFKNRHGLGNHQNLSPGQLVIAEGKLSLYEARGDYQLIIEQLNEAGIGELLKQYEQLKSKLSALGLFESARKKVLPQYPQTIGIITSTSGAALQDILTTLARRYPIAHVVIYPCEVQGKSAHWQLIQAILTANEDASADVLILARGGGSIEDLWAFNNEQLAFVIADSKIPIVSGIGHETDVTIADFVADLRAATPTAAAEAVSPNQIELNTRLVAISARILNALMRIWRHKALLLTHQIEKISAPKKLIMTHWQTLDYLQNQLHKAQSQHIIQKKYQAHLLSVRLQAQNPTALVASSKIKTHQGQQRLTHAIRTTLRNTQQKLNQLMATLHAVSPLATLDRGYAIMTHHGRVVSDSAELNLNDNISIRLAKGSLEATVTSVLQIDAI